MCATNLVVILRRWMRNMISIADIFGMMGMAFFLAATIKQWHKIHRTHQTTAISLTHYKLKIIAILCSLTCFSFAGLWLSFSVVSMELVVSVAITHMLIKYRGKKLTEMPMLDVREWGI